MSTAGVIQNNAVRSLAAPSRRKGAKTKEAVRAVWRRADCVTLDVDSTVCVDEGIDELATFMGVGEKVAKMTNAAMGGSLTFKDALRNRLGLICPSRADLELFLREHPPRLTPGVRELVQQLQERGADVYLVSGGFQAVIEPVARELGLPVSHVFANDILFDARGEYAGFDEERLTCAEGGKPVVLTQLRAKHGYEALVHLGDGATDLEARSTADAFIGFGGNVVREKVRAESAWFVTAFSELSDALNTRD